MIVGREVLVPTICYPQNLSYVPKRMIRVINQVQQNQQLQSGYQHVDPPRNQTALPHQSIPPRMPNKNSRGYLYFITHEYKNYRNCCIPPLWLQLQTVMRLRLSAFLCGDSAYFWILHSHHFRSIIVLISSLCIYIVSTGGDISLIYFLYGVPKKTIIFFTVVPICLNPKYRHICIAVPFALL